MGVQHILGAFALCLGCKLLYWDLITWVQSDFDTVLLCLTNSKHWVPVIYSKNSDVVSGMLWFLSDYFFVFSHQVWQLVDVSLVAVIDRFLTLLPRHGSKWMMIVQGQTCSVLFPFLNLLEHIGLHLDVFMELNVLVFFPAHDYRCSLWIIPLNSLLIHCHLNLWMLLFLGVIIMK